MGGNTWVDEKCTSLTWHVCMQSKLFICRIHCKSLNSWHWTSSVLQLSQCSVKNHSLLNADIANRYQFNGYFFNQTFSHSTNTYIQTPIKRPLFQDNLSKLASQRLNQSGFYWSKRWWGGSGIRWTICKSSAPHYRQITTPSAHLSNVLQAGCSSWRPTNSVKALNALLILIHTHVHRSASEPTCVFHCMHIRQDIFIGTQTQVHVAVAWQCRHFSSSTVLSGKRLSFSQCRRASIHTSQCRW